MLKFAKNIGSTSVDEFIIELTLGASCGSGDIQKEEVK